MNSYIKGVGHYLPAMVILNSDLERLVDTSDSWITERTGIKQRHIASKDEMTSDLAFQASNEALKMAEINPSDLQAIIVATATPDTGLPQTSCILQQKLNANRAFAFDLAAACSGFVYAMAVADSLIKAQGLNHVLVVGAETLSRITDYRDRETCILFGDGAGAVVLSRTDQTRKVNFNAKLYSDGTLGDLLTFKNERPKDPYNRENVSEISYLTMRGKEVFKNAVKAMSQASFDVLESSKINVSEVDWFIAHQANQRILSSVADSIGIHSDKVASNIEMTGNTSSASIPILMSQYIRAEKIKRGDKVLITAFGAGLTSGAAVFEY